MNTDIYTKNLKKELSQLKEVRGIVFVSDIKYLCQGIIEGLKLDITKGVFQIYFLDEPLIKAELESIKKVFPEIIISNKEGYYTWKLSTK